MAGTGAWALGGKAVRLSHSPKKWLEITSEGIIQLIRTKALTALTILSLKLVSEPNSFYIFLAHMVATFSIIGPLVGNLNGLAMEPMGHIDGFAAATIGSLSMIFAVLPAVPVGYAFNQTPFPLIGGVALFSGMGVLLMHLFRRYSRGLS